MRPFNKLLKLKLKRSTALSQLQFLVCCKLKNLCPNFISLKCNIKNGVVNSILETAKKKILRSVIKKKRLDISRMENEIYELHMDLGSHSSPLEFSLIDRIINQRVETLRKTTNFRLQKKLSNLINSYRKSGSTVLSSSDFSSPDYREHRLESEVNSTGFEKQRLENNINFQGSTSTHTPENVEDKEDRLVNLTSKPLDQELMDTLNLGLNFAFGDKTCPIEDFVTDTEAGLVSLPPQYKNLVRSEVCNTLINNQFKNNSSKSVLSKRVNDIIKNEDILISQADKGGKVILIERSEYCKKMETLLGGSDYCKISKKDDPTAQLMVKLKKLVKGSKFISGKDKTKVVPSNFSPPKIYGLVKIHKENYPLRPVVAGVGSPLHKLAGYLANKLSGLRESLSNVAINSAEFVKTVKDVKLDDCDRLVSIDVTSMFTKIPVNGALSSLKNRLQELHYCKSDIEDIMNLVNLCVSTTYFSYNGELYQQSNGLAMGSPLSPLLCDIFMDDFFRAILSNNQQKLPKLLVRYVDDLFLIWQFGKSFFEEFLKWLNDFNADIQFTYEWERDNKLPFLDVLVERVDSHFRTSVYRKECSISNIPHFKSVHPYAQKAGVFQTLVHRAFELCSDKRGLETEFNVIKKIAKSRGYSPKIVNNAIVKQRARRSIKSTLLKENDCKLDKFISLPYHPYISEKIGNSLRKRGFKIGWKPRNKLKFRCHNGKDKTVSLDKSGVYRLDCECGLGYIGQTCRKLQIRANEHKSYAKTEKNCSNSAIAKHCFTQKHTAAWDKPILIAHLDDHRRLNTRESVEILKQRDKIVNDTEGPILSGIWKPLFS